ncbi:MAG: nucleotidyltransferase domain-containing protein [bacterium]|nr:nucleotidyltransferase domain-containing protein [bacterium]
MKRWPELSVLSSREKKILSEVVQRIKEHFPETDIILYGSRVRGKVHPYSDIDILLLTKQEADYHLSKEIIRLLYDYELEYDVDIDPLIISKSDWESKRYRNHPLHENVDREGVVL